MTTRRNAVMRGSGPQTAFANTVSQFPLLVAGYGAGKTAAGILRTLKLKFANPHCDVAYYLPTYDLVRMIAYPRFGESLRRYGVQHTLNKSEHVINIRGRGSIIFRTMDNPERIVGYEVADSIVDELDVLKTDDARMSWQKIIARNRQKKRGGEHNTVGVVTTPEGFKFCYEQWAKTPTDGYEIIKASTYSNARNLPDGYIEALKRTYPSQLIDAYIDGEFVNLTSGAVYPDFDRVLNHSNATIQAGEPLHIGQDFNVYNCTSVVCVIRDDMPIIMGELTK